MIELRTLGELAIRCGERLVRLNTRKQSGTLVFLAAQDGRHVQREYLTHVFWSDKSSRRGLHSLSQALYQLKRTIPSLELDTSRFAISMPRSGFKLDLLDIDAALDDGDLDVVLNTYRGDFLEGFWIPATPHFDNWQEQTRSLLKIRVTRFLHKHLEQAEGRLDWSAAYRIASALARIDPENLYFDVSNMRAAAALGNYSEADIIRRRLRSMDENASVVASIKEVTDGVNATTEDRRSLLVRSPLGRFVGRKEVLFRLDTLWSHTRAGLGSLVVVAGEAGIGKTALANYFVNSAENDGAFTIRCRCHASERAVPYSGIVDGLAYALPSSVLRELPEIWAATLATLLPELDSTMNLLARLPRLDGASGRRRLFEAIARGLQTAAADRPLVWYVDDLHAADDATVAMLHYVFRRMRDRPFFFLATLRTEELSPGSPVQTLIDESQRVDAFEQLTLGPFSDQDARNLVSATAAKFDVTLDERTVAHIVNQSGGRPFFLIETVKALACGELEQPLEYSGDAVLFPRSLEVFFSQRFASLGRDARDILFAVVTLGPEATLESVSRVCNIAAEDTLHAGDVLVSQGWLELRNVRWELAHDLLFEAIRRSMSDARKQHMHYLAATYLKTRSPEPHTRIAQHLVHANMPEFALNHALQAAAEGRASHNHEEIEYSLRIAIECCDDDQQRFELIERLGRLLFDLRRLADADREYAKLEDSCSNAKDASNALVRIRARRCRIASRRTRTGDMLQRWLSLWTEALKLRDPEALTDLVWTQLALRLTLGCTKDDMEKFIPEMISVARSLPDNAFGVEALRCAAQQVAVFKSAFAAESLAVDALKRAELVGDSRLLIGVYNILGIVFACQGDLSRAYIEFTRGLEMAEQCGDVGARVTFVNQRSWVFLEQGRFQEAREGFMETLMHAQHQDLVDESMTAHANLAEIAMKSGAHDLAEEHCDALLALHHSNPSLWAFIAAYGMLGLCALERGRAAEAFRCKRELLAVARTSQYHIMDSSPAEILLARLDALEGHRANAIARLEGAIATYVDRDFFCRSKLRLERARLLVDQDPVEPEREARDVFERARQIGARPLAEKAEEVIDRVRFRRC